MEYLGKLLTQQACFRILEMLLDVFGSAPGRPSGLPKRPFLTSKMAPKWPPEGSWSPLGSLLAIVALILPLFLPPGGLLERSWTPSGPIQSALERPLGAPRRISRQFSTILGAKRLPKWSPGGSQIGSRRRLEPKTRISQKPLFSQLVSMIFEVPGHHFGPSNRSKTGSESHLRRGSPRKAS